MFRYDYIIPICNINNDGFNHRLLNLAVIVNMIPKRNVHLILVEQVLKHVSKNDKVSILDIGTGSGCIALALAHELPSAKIIGIDNSEKAIELAKSNVQYLHLSNAEFYCADILTEDIDGQFDIIVSNPPYIPISEIADLMPEVRDFEPHSALTDNADGLIFYRKFIEISNIILKAGGWLLLEVGIGEPPKLVKDMFSNDNFNNVELIKDLNGDDRVLSAQLR